MSESIQNWRPDDFVRQMFGIEPFDWQAESMLDLVHCNRVSEKTGHGVGKTAKLAWAAIHHIFTRSPALVICTAPTSLLQENLWSELNLWVRRMPSEFRAQLDVHPDKIVLLPSKGANTILARRTDVEAFAGFANENMLILVDEAAYVLDAVLEECASYNDAKIVLCGTPNPARVDGFFYDTFHDDSSSWRTRTAVCPDKEFVDYMREAFGEGSSIFRSRVLGEF